MAINKTKKDLENNRFQDEDLDETEDQWTNWNYNSQNDDKPQKNTLIILWVILAGIILVILLFTQKQTIPWEGHLSNPDSSGQSNSAVVKAWDSIKVDYVGKLQDWTVFDSSIEEYAKKAPDYSSWSWRNYEPLPFTVWAGQMIKWFDAWVVWMKLWEKRTLTIAPKDAYGEATIIQKVPAKYLNDNVEQDVPKESFQDVLVKTFPKWTLWEQSANAKVWDIIQEQWMTWKVTAIDDSWITLEITNNTNPFFGQKLEEWASADYQWNVITIKKVNADTVTVNILNKQNPFFGQKLVDWLTGKLPNGQDVKIIKINWDEIELETNNPQKLAGKTLIFDVEIKEINSK